jgi:protein-disulfide isomerase
VHPLRKLLLATLTAGLAAIVPMGWAAGTGQSAAHAKPVAQAEEGPPNKGLGSRDAPIKMEVFSDYSCPMCKNFYLGAVRRMLETYIPEGKVYVLHRDFPLKGVLGHEHSRDAARYANAAACIGKFREVDAALYEKQEVWSRDGSVDAVVAAVLTPKEMSRVRALVASGKMDAYIDSDANLGATKAVRSTPTIYVTSHGRTDPLPGNLSYALLRHYLDEQLQ